MFFDHNFTASHIDSLLQSENVTLQELMDEDDIIQECKTQNAKLIDFLTRPENLNQLVKMIVTEPPEDVDERIRFKYANLACELLTCDTPFINEKLSGDTQLLNELYNFIDTDKPLNPLMASFFSKTLGTLISRKLDQVLEFLQSKENFIPLLLRHLGTSAIMDLLLRLMVSIEGPELWQRVTNWLTSQKVIERVIELLEPTVEHECQCNASQLLCEMIRVLRDQAQQQERKVCDPLLATIESKEAVTLLLDNMLKGETKSESSLVCGISVLLVLLDLKRPEERLIDEGQHCDSQEHDSINASMQDILAPITPRLPEFHQLLVEPPKKPSMKTTVGVIEVPFGNTRLQIAKLIAALITLNQPSVHEEFAKLGTLDILLDLFFKYIWNNFLHSQVERIMSLILMSSMVENEKTKEELEESGSGDPPLSSLSSTPPQSPQPSPLLVHLFQKCQIVKRILNHWEENDADQKKEGGHRRGYMGHLTRMAQDLVDQASQGINKEFISQEIQKLPQEVKEKWDNFVQTTLPDITKTAYSITVEEAQASTTAGDSESEALRGFPYSHATFMQQALMQYHNQLTSRGLPDELGLHDEEFNENDSNLVQNLNRFPGMNFSQELANGGELAEELFEQECRKRSQQIEKEVEDGGPEDMWRAKEFHLPSSQSEAPERHHSSEEEDEGEHEMGEGVEKDTHEGKGKEVSMEVDPGDPWAGVGATEALPMDVGGNPWDSQSQANKVVGSNTSKDGEGWADFSKASEAFSATSAVVAADMDVSELKVSHPNAQKYVVSQDNEQKQEGSTGDDSPGSPMCMDSEEKEQRVSNDPQESKEEEKKEVPNGPSEGVTGTIDSNLPSGPNGKVQMDAVPESTSPSNVNSTVQNGPS